MSVAEGKPFHIGEHSRTELTDVYSRTLGHWPLYLFDGFGSFDPDVIYNRVEYLAQGLDVKIVFLDHLSILLSGLDGDERRMVDVTMTRLRSLVERTGITLFLVSHLRRTSGDHNHEEGARVNLGQLRGSAAIGQLSDAVIALERDQQNNTNTTVRVLKNRYTGEVGVCCELTYDLNTCRFSEHEPEKSSTQQRTSEETRALQFSTGEIKNGVIYLGADPDNCMAIRPNPPTPEMVQRAQPFRADTLQSIEAAIKNCSTIIDV